MPDILSNLDLKIYVTSILLLILNDHGLSTLEKLVNTLSYSLLCLLCF